MNLDARIEALVQSVELLAAMHKDTEKEMQRSHKEYKQLAARNTRLEELVTEIAEGTARLLHVVEAHEHRISDLEGNQRQ